MKPPVQFIRTLLTVSVFALVNGMVGLAPIATLARSTDALPDSPLASWSDPLPQPSTALLLAQARKLARYNPPQPPPSPRPGSRASAGSRSCTTAVKPIGTPTGADQPLTPDKLVAIAPEFETPNVKALTKVTKHVWALTSAAQPMFWFNVPYTQGTAKAQFVLKDANDAEVYQTAVTLSDKPGIIGVRLPQSVALEPGKQYHWYFKVRLTCLNQPLEYVEGLIERREVEAIVSQQLQAASPLQKAQIYADAGFWHDAVTALALANQSAAERAANWRSLMESVGLDELDSVPLVQP